MTSIEFNGEWFSYLCYALVFLMLKTIVAFERIVFMPSR